MSKNRLPNDKANVSGASLKNPGRYKGRLASSGLSDLGEPYENMSDEQKACWYEFAADLPWLKSSDRMIVRLACFLSARMDSGEIRVSAGQV